MNRAKGQEGKVVGVDDLLTCPMNQICDPVMSQAVSRVCVLRSVILWTLHVILLLAHME